LYITDTFTQAEWLTNIAGGGVCDIPGSKNSDKVERKGDVTTTVCWQTLFYQVQQLFAKKKS